MYLDQIMRSCLSTHGVDIFQLSGVTQYPSIIRETIQDSLECDYEPGSLPSWHVPWSMSRMHTARRRYEDIQSVHHQLALDGLKMLVEYQEKRLTKKSRTQVDKTEDEESGVRVTNKEAMIMTLNR
jgi:hypothetical protein